MKSQTNELRSSKLELSKLGLHQQFLTEAHAFPQLFAGRIISQYKGLYKIAREDTILTGEVSGKFHHLTDDPSAYPVVGDFVMIDREDDTAGNALIHAVLSRKSTLSRKSAGTTSKSQIIASNIDTVFICMSLNKDFNVRRIERYLSLVWDSGAIPVIVLTKSDLAHDIEGKLAELEAVTMGVDVLVTSSVEENGHAALMNHIKEGQTAAFIGSSGVGKSTLINHLLGKHLIETSNIRDDDKGRHTTTRRELFMLEQGGMLIDTPGMREVGIDEVDLSRSFSDIEELSWQCKFNDCSHVSEPRCAIQNAIHSGELSKERFANYLRLKREAGYAGLSSRQIEAAKIDEFGGTNLVKQVRRFAKENNKRKHG